MAETKAKRDASLRTPGPKKKLGLSVPPALRLPHDDLIFPVAEVTGTEPGESARNQPSQTSHASMTRQPSQTSHASTTRHSSQTRQTSKLSPLESSAMKEDVSVAPQRDYTKVANSIGRQAVPAGLFTGKSKQLYDCLYSLTRGAIVPVRSIRISRPKLMARANIGSRVTFDANIERLFNVGLISVRQITGEHEGNEYTVHLPEEVVTSTTSQTSQTTQSSMTSHAQNLDRLVGLETSQSSQTLSSEESIVSGSPKTSFKTKIENDDEAAAAVKIALIKMIEDLTGREATAVEFRKLVEVVEVLTLEGKIAAARTTVSSAGPFLAEHLRRRLFKKNKQELATEVAGPIQHFQLTADKEQCPDCAGNGFYYPNGYENGVAKCRHQRLLKQERTDATGLEGLQSGDS